MKRIFVFDLYDTVLTDISFSFVDGLKYLYNNYFISKCSFDELNEYSETFLPLYEKRKTQNVEICLIQDEIPLYFKRFGVDLPSNIDDLEYTVMNIMQKVYLEEPIKNTIRALYDIMTSHGIDFYGKYDNDTSTITFTLSYTRKEAKL